MTRAEAIEAAARRVLVAQMRREGAVDPCTLLDAKLEMRDECDRMRAALALPPDPPEEPCRECGGTGEVDAFPEAVDISDGAGMTMPCPSCAEPKP